MKIQELIQQLQNHYSLLENVRVGVYKDSDIFFTVEETGWTINDDQKPQVYLCV